MDIHHPNRSRRGGHLPNPNRVIARKLGNEPVRRVCRSGWTMGCRPFRRILPSPVGRIGTSDVECWEMVVRCNATVKIHAFRLDMRSSFLRTVKQCRATDTSWGWL